MFCNVKFIESQAEEILEKLKEDDKSAVPSAFFHIYVKAVLKFHIFLEQEIFLFGEMWR